jgi:hypothetical protein
MRRALSVLVALVALLAFAATPAFGQEGPPEQYRFSFRQTGLSADAFWETCQVDTPEPGLTTCQSVSIFGFEGERVVRESGAPAQRQTGEACVSFYVTEDGMFPPISEEFGCTQTFEFDAADDLSSASLSATIPVEAIVCTETPEGTFCEPSGEVTRQVVVTADWTAIGPTTRFTDRSSSRTETDGTVCFYRQSGRGVRADAVATATVDGTALGDSQFAMITKGTFRSVEGCR